MSGHANQGALRDPRAACLLLSLFLMGTSTLQAQKGVKNRVDHLRGNLTNKNAYVRYQATLSLSEMGMQAEKAVPQLLKALKDVSPSVRAGAVDALGKTGAKNAVPHLIIALNDSDLSVRQAAAIALGTIDSDRKEILRQLITAARGANQPSRTDVASALRNVVSKTQALLPLLIDALTEEKGSTRQVIVMALGNIGPHAKDAVSSLVSALTDEDSTTRQGAAWALGRIGPDAKSASTDLILMLKDRDKGIRLAALLSLREIRPEVKQVVAPFIDLLKDEDATIQENAADALGNMGTGAREAINPLIDALKASKQYIREKTASALVRVVGRETQEAVGPLADLLGNDDAFIRKEAAEALERIGPGAEEAVPSLVRALSDGDEDVRKAAGDALGEVGWGAREALRPLTDALKDERLGVRASAAMALSDIAATIQDARGTDYIDELKAAHNAVAESSVPAGLKRELIAPLRRAIEYLELEKSKSLEERLLERVRRHSYITIGIASYALLLTLWFILLWKRPFWLLQINDALKPHTDFKLPDWLGGINIPTRYVFLIGFFHYRFRVLDAWIAKRISLAREKFQELETVRNREVHVTVPVIVDRSNVSSLTGLHLRSIFADRRGCLLIWGEGGSGKTSLGCQIAKWAMSSNKAERLSDHPMLPVLIEQELDFDVAKEKQHFTEAIRGQLQALIGEAEPVSKELLDRLLRHRRILVIVDHFSEMSDATRRRIRPANAEFPVGALVVTSRIEEPLDGVPKTTIKTLRIQGNRLSSFMDDYLKALGKRELFEDVEYFEACRRLSMMVGDRDITVLLAKLYAEQMVATEEETLSGDLPENIPDLMLAYLNELNREAKEGDPDDRTLHLAAKAIAWECVKNTYRPTAAKRHDVLNALDGDAKPELLARYLEERLRLIQTTQPRQDRIQFVLDPLAEYLAALHLVEHYQGNEEAWRNFLSQVDNMPGAPESTREFLLAVRDCCLARGVECAVPDFVTEELGRLAGLEPEITKRVQLEQRTRRLIAMLNVPEAEDRVAALDGLAGIGHDAEAALPNIIRMLDGDSDRRVRAKAAEAFGKIEPQSEKAVRILIELLKDEAPDVRRAAVYALGNMGSAAKDAVGPLIVALNDRDLHIRAKAAQAIGDIGAEQAVEALVAALEKAQALTAEPFRDDGPEWSRESRLIFHRVTLDSLRSSLLYALTDIEPEWEGAGRAVPSLQCSLSDQNETVRYFAVRVLGKLGAVARSKIPELINTLEHDQDEEVRCEAALTLIAIRMKDDLEIELALRAACNDPSHEVREVVEKALQTAISNSGERRID